MRKLPRYLRTKFAFFDCCTEMLYMNDNFTLDGIFFDAKPTKLLDFLKGTTKWDRYFMNNRVYEDLILYFVIVSD